MLVGGSGEEVLGSLGVFVVWDSAEIVVVSETVVVASVDIDEVAEGCVVFEVDEVESASVPGGVGVSEDAASVDLIVLLLEESVGDTLFSPLVHPTPDFVFPDETEILLFSEVVTLSSLLTDVIFSVVTPTDVTFSVVTLTGVIFSVVASAADSCTAGGSGLDLDLVFGLLELLTLSGSLAPPLFKSSSAALITDDSVIFA